MDCSGARATLWPPDRPRLLSGVVEAARLHVKGCAACQEYFSQEPSLLDLYDRARITGAPHEVRSRIVRALADEPLPGLSLTPASGSPPTRRLALGMVLAALTTIAIVAGASRSADAPNVFVEDYLRRAVGEDHIETDDPAEVTLFFQRALGIRVVPISLTGLSILRAELCLLKGQRGAMIVYNERGARVMHYLVPAATTTARAPALSGRRPETAEMPVVTWATPRVEQALVGEVSADRLLEIAVLGGSQPLGSSE